MAEADVQILEDEVDLENRDGVKVILLGDSAVGKSRLIERYLMDYYTPIVDSTFALTLYSRDVLLNGERVQVDFWDTAGQERFSEMHPSYYNCAHVCLLVFDVSERDSYSHLSDWYKELRSYRPNIPCFLLANKIDLDTSATQTRYKFAVKNELPMYYVSASDGTNVVRVFCDAIAKGYEYKTNPENQDLTDQIMSLLNEDGFDLNDEDVDLDDDDAELSDD